MERKANVQLLDIPEEVFRTSLFPYLRVNELLRLRRVCHRTKNYAEDYLRRHPRSRTVLRLRTRWTRTGRAAPRSSTTPGTLPNFIQQDRLCSIRRPINRISMGDPAVNYFNYYLTSRFLSRYGHQIEHVEVDSLEFPIPVTGFNFFEKFPKLKSLRVDDLQKKGWENPNLEMIHFDSITFPPTLKNLKKLDIWDLLGSEWPILWKMVEFCTNLEYLNIPWSSAVTIPTAIQSFKEILGKNKHKQLKYLDTTSICSVDKDAFRVLLELVVSQDLKLLNICNGSLWWLSRSGFNENDVSAFRNRVLSVCYMPHHQQDSIPNVLPHAENAEVFMTHGMPTEHLAASLKRDTLPALTKLLLYFSRSPPALGSIWKAFPKLEELSLKFYLPLEAEDPNNYNNVVFLGPDPEQPSFLQLTGLRKLTLVLGNNNFKSLTDYVLFRVIRYMKLQELRLISRQPIKSFTGSGLRVLLDRNFPFANSIEMFPFDKWTLDGIVADEFQQLARQFPCNQF